MRYNFVEQELDRLLAAVMRLPFPDREVTSRINGVDGKVEILKAGVIQWQLSGEEKLALAETLGNGGFGLLKTYRDLVIHARLYDAKTSIARGAPKRGKVSEILLTSEALEGLDTRLGLVLDELFALHGVFSLRQALMLSDVDDPERGQLELGIQERMAEYHRYRTCRQSLPPLPEFPGDTAESETAHFG